MRLGRCLFILTVLLSLCACAPVYETKYNYEPPRSNSGKMCAAQCIQNKTTCQQMCQMRNESCLSRARTDALYEYEIYKQEQQAHSRPVDRSLSSFDYGWRCHEACDCDSAFNMCYQTCGGVVNEYQVCTAFCDQ